MKKLLILVMACYGLNARSQINESRDFLYLYSDSTVYAKKIRLRPDFSGTWTLRADSRRVPLNQVKFFNNEDGFFANVRNSNIYGESSFSERVISGKINLYQTVVYDALPYESDYYKFRSIRPQTVNTRMFYNKGYLDLKKVNYNSLSLDMADNPRSLDFLKDYRASRRLGTAMYVAAGATLIVSAITFFSGSGLKQTGNISTAFGSRPDYSAGRIPVGSFVLMGLSAGLGVSGYLIQSSGDRNIEKAINAYNK